MPGPGSYDIKTLVGSEAQMKSFGIKYSEDRLLRDSRNLPGPGAYSSVRNSFNNSPAFKMGTSKRQ